MASIRISCITLAFLLLSLNVFPQTFISGGIYSNSTWAKANSPYIITDTVVVFPGVKLTIEPGVVVRLEDNIRLEIRGELDALGSITDTILFTSNNPTPTSGQWLSVFLNSAIARLDHCIFEYAKYGIQNNQEINDNDSLIVKNSIFRYNDIGVYNRFQYDYNSFDSCSFIYNGEGFHAEYEQTGAKFNFCSFVNNNDGCITSSYSRSTLLENCTISNNHQYGVVGADVHNSSVTSNNIGIRAGKVLNSTVSNNVTGIEWSELVDSSTISGNIHGVRAMEISNSNINSNSTVGIFGGGNIHYNIITNNGTGILLEDSVYTISHNVIENNDIGIEVNANNYIFCNKICNNNIYDLRYTRSINISVASNYWCTPDSASISAVIYDGYDNINYGLVQFLPHDTSHCYQALNISTPVNQWNYLKIFPNPTIDNFVIELPDNIKEAVLIIYAITGEAILKKSIDTGKSVIDVSHLSAGVYIITIADQVETIPIKFIKKNH